MIIVKQKKQYEWSTCFSSLLILEYKLWSVFLCCNCILWKHLLNCLDHVFLPMYYEFIILFRMITWPKVVVITVLKIWNLHKHILANVLMYSFKYNSWIPSFFSLLLESYVWAKSHHHFVPAINPMYMLIWR